MEWLGFSPKLIKIYFSAELMIYDINTFLANVPLCHSNVPFHGTFLANLVNKNSSFANFVSFRPYTYTRAQQFLPPLWTAMMDYEKTNKRNNKRFNNRGYSLSFLLGIFLKRLWLIPNILKWQDCKIFAKLVVSKIFTKPEAATRDGLQNRCS